MEYTTGNWSITSLTLDTDPTSKNIAVPNLTYSSDFKRTKDEPKDAAMTNITSGGVISAEEVQYGRSLIPNIYTGLGIDANAQLAHKGAVQAMNKIIFYVRATNSVSGQEVMIPNIFYLVGRVSTSPIVTGDLVDYGLKRCIANAFATGKTDESRMMELFKGSLLPVN